MFLPLVFAVLLAVVVYFVQWYLKRKSLVDQWNKLPSRPRSFLFGNIRDVIKIYTRKHKYHAGVYILERILGQNLLFLRDGMFAFWIGPAPIVAVYSPEWMEMVLSSNVSLEKSFEYKFMHKWLGLGLLTSKGPKWRSRRKLLTPCFHFRILEDFLPTFDEQSLVLVGKLRERAEDEDVNVTPLVTLCTLDIVCETVMGVHIGAQSGKNLDYTTAVHNLGDNFNQRTIRPWLVSDFVFDLTEKGRDFKRDLRTIHSFTRKVIQEKKAAAVSKRGQSRDGEQSEDESGSRKRRQALMDLLLDQFLDGGHLTEEDIQEEVETFMFAGHDTTAVGVTYALYSIGLYPDVQRLVHEELDSIFLDDVTRPVTMDDVRRMKYLECVLKESQRVFPSVPIIGRKLQEDISHNGFVIPRGTEVHCNIISLHRHPDSFPNPEVFDPDRFLPENVLKRHAYAYVPFSAGPRNCIGQKFAGLETKVIVANILRNFRIVSLDPRDRIHLKMEFTLKPAEPIRLKFLPRNL